MKDNIKFTIPGKPEYLTMVRLAISSIATNVGFGIREIEDTKTAVEEACKTISCHGYSGYSDKYELECNADKGYLEIIVTDMCDEHSLEKNGAMCPNCPCDGDVGVEVIQSLMDNVEITKNYQGRKSIKMVKQYGEC